MVTHDSRGVSVATTFRVGDKVEFQLADRSIRGDITEIRGPIGAGGRHLYSVRVHVDYAEPMTYELPAEKLRLAK